MRVQETRQQGLKNRRNGMKGIPHLQGSIKVMEGKPRAKEDRLLPWTEPSHMRRTSQAPQGYRAFLPFAS